jgi:hypothetical protein
LPTADATAILFMFMANLLRYRLHPGSSGRRCERFRAYADRGSHD